MAARPDPPAARPDPHGAAGPDPLDKMLAAALARATGPARDWLMMMASPEAEAFSSDGAGRVPAAR